MSKCKIEFNPTEDKLQNKSKPPKFLVEVFEYGELALDEEGNEIPNSEETYIVSKPIWEEDIQFANLDHWAFDWENIIFSTLERSALVRFLKKLEGE